MKRFFKYCGVGGLGTLISLVVFVLLNEVWEYYLLSSLAAFLVAATCNYILNNVWVFSDRGHKTSKKLYTKFMLVSVFSLGVNLIVLWIMQKYIMPQMLTIHLFNQALNYSAECLHIKNVHKLGLLISQAVGIGCSMLINFLGNNFITFKKKN